MNLDRGLVPEKGAITTENCNRNKVCWTGRDPAKSVKIPPYIPSFPYGPTSICLPDLPVNCFPSL